MATVYFSDVARDFVQHYLQIFAEGAERLASMYAENALLRIGDATYHGRDAVVAEVTKLKSLQLAVPQKPYVAQPFKTDGSVLVTSNMKTETAAYIITFILSIVGEGNRFGITDQLFHLVSP
jgi:hypothetical protein